MLFIIQLRNPNISYFVQMLIQFKICLFNLNACKRVQNMNLINISNSTEGNIKLTMIKALTRLI